MQNKSLRVIVGLITFACGVVLSGLWLIQHRTTAWKPTVGVTSTSPQGLVQSTQSVELHLRQYNNDEAILAFENNTDKPIYIAYEPTTRRRPARVVYHLERQVSKSDKPEAFETEMFDAFPGWNPVPPQSTIIFKAFCPQDKRGHIRVFVGYLEKAETAEVANGALDDPKTFDEKIARRNREMREAHSEWFTLPVSGEVTVPNNSTRRAVNELPAQGEQDIIENEDAVINLLQTGYGSGQINCFYGHKNDQQQFCTFEELVNARWLNETDKEYKGYRITLTLSEDRKHYEAVAVPIKYGETGVFSFYANEDDTRGADRQGMLATGSDPSIFRSDRWRNR
jgi:hypothetical protein